MRVLPHCLHVKFICNRIVCVYHLLLVEMLKRAGSSLLLCAIVMSRILYALPAWGGFLSNDLVAKFDVFFFKKSCSLRLQQ